MITTLTFAERMYNCSSFKQESNYDSIIRNTCMEIVKSDRTNSDGSETSSIFSLLYQKLNSKSAQLRKVYVADKIAFEDYIISIAQNITKFFNSYELENAFDEYVFRYKIKGHIVGQIKINNKTYNVDFSIRNTTDTFYHLYYYKLNFFLYNQTNGTKHDGLVYLPASDSMYLIKYDENNYTMNRGFLDYNINSRAVRPSHQCLYCVKKNCKPRLITNIERFSS